MTDPESCRDLTAEARRALHNTQGPNPPQETVVVAAGGIPPRWGCALVAHEKLGWCASCRGVAASVEAMGWRLWASGHPQDVDWARAVTREIRMER